MVPIQEPDRKQRCGRARTLTRSTVCYVAGLIARVAKAGKAGDPRAPAYAPTMRR